MTKTEICSLPQWEATDPVRREDFNRAMANIDAGLMAASYTTGHYVGNGLSMAEGGLEVELGFRPRFLIIAKGWAKAAASQSMVIVSEYPNEEVENIVVFTDTGFIAGRYDASASIKINQDGVAFGYVTFR